MNFGCLIEFSRIFTLSENELWQAGEYFHENRIKRIWVVMNVQMAPARFSRELLTIKRDNVDLVIYKVTSNHNTECIVRFSTISHHLT